MLEDRITDPPDHTTARPKGAGQGPEQKLALSGQGREMLVTDDVG
jgi:hypothetical protein